MWYVMLKSTAEVPKSGESAWGGVEEESKKARLLKLRGVWVWKAKMGVAN